MREKKSYVKLAFLLVFLSLFNSKIFAQSETGTVSQPGLANSPKTIEEKLKSLEGIIQIQVKDPRLRPNIPYNIDEIVEKNRKPNKTAYVSLGTAVRLMILPESAVINEKEKMELISTFN